LTTIATILGYIVLSAVLCCTVPAQDGPERGWIACSGYVPRSRGHGSAGGRIWSVTAAGRAEVGA
jgi:hypothetical protein